MKYEACKNKSNFLHQIDPMHTKGATVVLVDFLYPLSKQGKKLSFGQPSELKGRAYQGRNFK